MTAVYLVLILLILYVSGFGLTLLLLPAQWERFRLIVMPVVGLAATIVFDGFLNLLGVPTRVGAPAVLAALALLDLGVFWKQRKQLSFRNDHRRPFLFSAIGTIACAWPMFYLGVGYMGFVNRDVLIYTATARHLQTDTYFNPPPYVPDHPVQYIVHDILINERVGSQFFLSSVSSLMGLDPKPVYMPVIFALYFLTPLTAFALWAGFLGGSVRVASLASFLIAVSSISAFGYLYQLLAQSQAIPLMILSIGVVIDCLKRTGWRSVALAALLAVATVSTYVEISPFALGTPFLAGAVFLYLRQIRLRRFLAVAGIFLGAAAVFLTPIYGSRLAVWLLKQAGGAVGNAMSSYLFPYMLIESGPPAVFGLVAVPYSSSTWSVTGFGGQSVLLLLAAICALLLAAGLWQQIKERKYTILVVSVLWFGLSLQLFHSDAGFGELKLTMYMQFLIVGLVSAGVVWLWDRSPSWKTAMKFFVAGFVVLNLVAMETYGVASLGRTRGTWVEWSGISETNALEEVRDAANQLPAKAHIVVGVVDLLPQNWLAYMLKDRSIRMLQNTSAFGAQGLLEQRFPLLVESSEGGWREEGRPRFEIKAGQSFQGAGDQPLITDPDTYFLVWNDAKRPQDFASTGKSCRHSVWRNDMFCLVPASQLQDFVLPVSGHNRNFWYLDGQFGPRTAWYALEQHSAIMKARQAFRWLNNSGLLMVYKPSQSTVRLAVDLINGFGNVVGVGHDLSDRHIRVYCDGRLVDEVHVRGWTRFVSKPFHVQSVMSLIELQVAEDVNAVARHPALWKPYIPGDYRRLNVAVSNVRLLSEDDYARIQYPQSVHFDTGGNWQFSVGQVNGIFADSWVSEEGELWLRKPAGAREYTMEGNLSLPPTMAPRATIEVLFDDQTVAQLRLNKLGPFHLTVPLPHPEEGERVVRVRLRSDQCFVPHRTFGGSDNRELSFQLVSAGFR